MEACSINGCSKPRKTKGYCSAHYTRLLRHGDPLGGRIDHGEPIRFLKALIDHSGDACVAWPYAKLADGRGMIAGRSGVRPAARIMCTLAHGEPSSEDLEAAHSCGNGHLACVNPNHLRWATRAENQADRALHGTANRGERQGRSKMKEADVLALRARYANGERLCDLAASSGFQVATIEAAVKGRSWRWLGQGV